MNLRFRILSRITEDGVYVTRTIHRFIPKGAKYTLGSLVPIVSKYMTVWYKIGAVGREGYTPTIDLEWVRID